MSRVAGPAGRGSQVQILSARPIETRTKYWVRDPVTRLPDANGIDPVPTLVAFTRDLPSVEPEAVLFVLWALFMVSATSTGVNLIDGMDGLAAGACALAFAGYSVIGRWQTNHAGRWHGEPVARTLEIRTTSPSQYSRSPPPAAVPFGGPATRHESSLVTWVPSPRAVPWLGWQSSPGPSCY